MRVIFSHNFINQILVSYQDLTSEMNGFIIKSPTTEKVVNKVSRTIDEDSITEVVLVGRTSVLRGLEDYYTKFKEVNIKWQ